MNARVELTYDICMAAGQDAGNRHMRKHGRTAWNEDDWNAAARVSNELLGILNAKQEVGDENNS